MKLTNIIICCIIIFSSIINTINCDRKSIKCSQKKFEELFGKLMLIGDENLGFPEKHDEIDKFCNINFRLIPKVEQYKKRCFKDTLKNFVSVLIYSIRTHIKRYCSKRNSVRVRELLTAAPCINQNALPLKQCFDNLSNNFAAIKYSPNQLKMPQICCQYVEMVNCFTDVMQKNGCEKMIPVVVDQVQSVMGNFVDSSCGDYTTDSDKCEKLQPVPKMKQKTNQTFLFNLVDIFDSLEQ